MTLIKKTLLSAAAVAVMTSLVGCGDDPVAPKKPVTPVQSGAAAKANGGWSDVAGDGGTVTYGDKDDTSFTVNLKRPKGDGNNVWPTAAATASVTEGNFEGLTSIILTYKVNKVTPNYGEGAADANGLAFYLAKEDSEGATILGGEVKVDGKDYSYGAFRAVSSVGFENVGTEVSDTLTLDEFMLDYGYDTDNLLKAIGLEGKSGDEGEVLLSNNTQILDTLSSVGFVLEHDVSTAEDELDITVKSIKFIGAKL